MLRDPTHWYLGISRERFAKLKTQGRFWQLVALSRAVNALRFVHVALLAYEHEDDSLRAGLTRFNSFFFNCALLHEALLLVQRLPKHYRNVAEFSKLHKILKDPLTSELRTSILGPVRNRLTFHFDEDEIGAQLKKTEIPPRFVAGEGETNGNVYYELADLCTLGMLLESSLEAPDALEKVEQRMADITDLQIGS